MALTKAQRARDDAKVLPASSIDRGLLIGGELITAVLGRQHQHIYPATGEPNVTVPLAGAAEIDRAVASAREAQRAWMSLTVDVAATC